MQSILFFSNYACWFRWRKRSALGYNKDKINNFPTLCIQSRFPSPQEGQGSKPREEILAQDNMNTCSSFPAIATIRDLRVRGDPNTLFLKAAWICLLVQLKGRAWSVSVTYVQCGARAWPTSHCINTVRHSPLGSERNYFKTSWTDIPS